MVLDCNPRFSSEKVPTAELVTSVSLLKNFPRLGQPDEVVDLIHICLHSTFLENGLLYWHFFSSPGGVKQGRRAEQSSRYSKHYLMCLWFVLQRILGLGAGSGLQSWRISFSLHFFPTWPGYWIGSSVSLNRPPTPRQDGALSPWRRCFSFRGCCWCWLAPLVDVGWGLSHSILVGCEETHLFMTSDVSLELVIFISLAAFAFGHILV